MHSSISFVKATASTSLTTWSGFGRQNIALYNGLAIGDADAVLGEGESMDLCLSHASPNNYAQHAHSISPCACDSCSGSTTTKPGACNDAGKDCLPSDYSSMYEGWTTSDGTYGGFYGLAKDGHVIYGPFNADGDLWACEDVDMCNGFFLSSGDYAYASTTFFPYIVGCWGPASSDHTYLPTCTTNGCSEDFSISGVNFSAILLLLTAINMLA